MEKILVVSDSHGMDFGIRKIVNEEGPFDRMIHLGDSQCSEFELRDIVKCSIDIVNGNNDWGYHYPNEKLLIIGKHKILLIHGHTKGVNFGFERLMYYGLEKGVDIVLFGHTHVPTIREFDGIKLVNPGSITLPRQKSRKPSWILMEVDDEGDIKINFRELK